MINEDKIRRSFLSVKVDMDKIKKEITTIKSEITSLKKSPKIYLKKYIVKKEVVKKNMVGKKAVKKSSVKKKKGNGGKSKYSDEQKAEAVNLAKQGLSLSEIVAKMPMGKKAIIRYAEAANVEIKVKEKKK